MPRPSASFISASTMFNFEADAPETFHDEPSVKILDIYSEVETITGFTDRELDCFPRIGSDFQPRTHSGIPGVRCPQCLETGQEQWVIRGKMCPNCGTVCS